VTSDEPKPGPEQVLGLLIQQLVKIVEEQEKGQYPAKGHAAISLCRISREPF
jgi:hypothetical protein